MKYSAIWILCEPPVKEDLGLTVMFKCPTCWGGGVFGLPLSKEWRKVLTLKFTQAIGSRTPQSRISGNCLFLKEEYLALDGQRKMQTSISTLCVGWTLILACNPSISAVLGAQDCVDTSVTPQWTHMSYLSAVYRLALHTCGCHCCWFTISDLQKKSFQDQLYINVSIHWEWGETILWFSRHTSSIVYCICTPPWLFTSLLTSFWIFPKDILWIWSCFHEKHLTPNPP